MTPLIAMKQLKSVLDKLEGISELTIFWFDSYLKLNTDKCYLLVSGTKYKYSWARKDDDKIWESNEVKLLGVTSDNKFKFDSHIANTCFKANQKLSLLSRLAGLLTFDRKQILFKAFFESQFKYCPLIWMFVAEQPIIELINHMK